jgi:hypothetical protein
MDSISYCAAADEDDDLFSLHLKNFKKTHLSGAE